MREKSSGIKIKVMGERVDLGALDPAYLTNNVYAIHYREDEGDKAMVDLVIGKRVDIFDAYYDLGYIVEGIWHADGRRNPKFQECELRVKG
jgi:hypothetical protein